MRTRLLAILSLSLVCLGVSACGSSNKDAVPPDPNACPPGQLCPQPTTTMVTPAPTVTTTATAPAPTGTASGSTATPLAPLAAAAVTPILTQMGASEAPGLKPDGSAFAGQFQEGQTLEQPINIQAGKCYAVVAAAVGGITELDIQLVAQTPPLPAVVLAQDSTTGPTATLGGKGQCFRNPFPIGGPGKVILKATKGGGLAAAQVFVK